MLGIQLKFHDLKTSKIFRVMDRKSVLECAREEALEQAEREAEIRRKQPKPKYRKRRTPPKKKRKPKAKPVTGPFEKTWSQRDAELKVQGGEILVM